MPKQLTLAKGEDYPGECQFNMYKHHEYYQNQYRADIDGLRAIAVLAVLAFHAFPNFVKGGFVGVDIFFVISGYLISGIIFKSLEAGTFNFLNFYARRIKRIFPALLAVIITTWILGYILLIGESFQNLGKHMLYSTLFFENFLLKNQVGYFDIKSELKPLLHLWSLSIEEQFYIIWPLIIYLFSKTKINIFRWFSFLAIVSFALSIIIIDNDYFGSFYLPHTRFWEFILGGLVAKSQIDKLHLKPNSVRYLFSGLMLEVYSCIGFLFIVAAFIFLDKSKPWPAWWTLLPTIGVILLIAPGQETWLNKKVLSNNLLVGIGKISYPLYLWHYPLLSLLRNAVEVPSFFQEFSVLILALFLSWVTFEYLEKPIRFGKFSKFNIPVLIICAVGVGFLGMFTYFKEGLNGHISQNKQFLINYSNKTPPASPHHFSCETKVFKEFYGCMTIEEKLKNFPLVVVWGDSHATDLIYGLQYIQDDLDNFRIAMFSLGQCPPFIGGLITYRASKDCFNRNLLVVKKIFELKANTVILIGHYSLYTDYLTELEKVINFLKKGGVQKVIIVGQLPEWSPTLSNALLKKYSQSPFDIPNRMHFGLELSRTFMLKSDKELKILSDRLGVKYISPIDIICNVKGCLTFIGDNDKDLIVHDSTHLTDGGSRYFVRQAFGSWEKLF